MIYSYLCDYKDAAVDYQQFLEKLYPFWLKKEEELYAQSDDYMSEARRAAI